MTEHHMIGLVGVIVLGVVAQWLAWRLGLPSILLLLVIGILAGPVTSFSGLTRFWVKRWCPSCHYRSRSFSFRGWVEP